MLSYAIGGFLSGMVGDRMRMSTVIAGGLAGSALCVLLLAGGAADHLLQKTVRRASQLDNIMCGHGLRCHFNTALHALLFGGRCLLFDNTRVGVCLLVPLQRRVRVPVGVATTRVGKLAVFVFTG